MLTIAIADTPSQVIGVQLAGQNCRIDIRTTTQGLFASVYVDDALVIGGVACRNMTKIVRERYRGFVGDLMFQDTQGAEDPIYPGLGSRWVLCYLESGDL